MKSLLEWATHILFLESKVASTAEYTLDTLFNEAQSKYTTLLNQGLWHPSNKTLEEKPWQWFATTIMQETFGFGQVQVYIQP